MTPSDIAISLAALLAAFGVGSVFGGSPVAWLLAALLFAAMAIVMVQTKMRAVVAVPVLAGGFVGALAGTATVQAMCLPGTCATIANTAGIVTGIGGIVGVGLVVALTVRSFDEYRTAIATGKPPPTVGCETDERP